MKLNIRALIFDLDGVLTNTPWLHYESWKRLAEDERIPFTLDQHYQMQGLVRRDSLAVFLNGTPVDEPTAQALMDRKNAYFLEALEQLSPADCLPGVVEIIREAHAAGLKIGLGSSSQNARRVLDKLGLFRLFDVIGDGYSVNRHKPAPDIFLWVAGQLGVLPQESVVFEDSVAGMQAAVAGGFWRVGVGGRHGDGAHIAVNSLADLRLASLLDKLINI
jgi:beta-phosphoglucomutase